VVPVWCSPDQKPDLLEIEVEREDQLLV
jgi:hypothetical protein